MNGGRGRTIWRAALFAALGLALSACTSAAPLGSTATATVTASPAPSSTGSTASVNPSQTAAPLTTGIVKGKNGWSTYTNVELGFSLKFPTKVYVSNGSPCGKRQLKGDWTYGQKSGVVPTTVVANGAEFWLGQATAYQLGSLTEKTIKSYIYDYYKSCTKRMTSVTLLRAYEAGNTTYFLTGLPIIVEPAHNQTDVQDALSAIFSNCPDLVLNNTSPSSNGPWRVPAYSCPKNPAFQGGATDARWYKDKNLFVAFLLGQAYHIYNSNKQPVDKKVVASFTVLP